jgi:hypothetical protein
MTPTDLSPLNADDGEAPARYAGTFMPICITGSPGAGRSSLAGLAEALRTGAIDTFDGHGYLALLRRVAGQTGTRCMRPPTTAPPGNPLRAQSPWSQRHGSS